MFGRTHHYVIFKELKAPSHIAEDRVSDGYSHKESHVHHTEAPYLIAERGRCIMDTSRASNIVFLMSATCTVAATIAILPLYTLFRCSRSPFPTRRLWSEGCGAGGEIDRPEQRARIQ